MNEELIARVTAGGIALIGAAMILFNKKCADDVLHNHRLFGGEASGTSNLKKVYRLLFVMAGLLFFTIGILGTSGVITPGR